MCQVLLRRRPGCITESVIIVIEPCYGRIAVTSDQGVIAVQVVNQAQRACSDLSCLESQQFQCMGVAKGVNAMHTSMKRTQDAATRAFRMRPLRNQMTDSLVHVM
jgi:hypothetical protein